MQKLAVLAVLLGLVAISTALPALHFIETTTFDKLKNHGWAFCLPVGYKPKGAYQATIQFVFDKPTKLDVQFTDSHMFHDETSTPVHAISLQSLSGESSQAWNPASLLHSAAIAGAVKSADAKLLKVILQLGAVSQEDLTKDESASATCQRWMQNVDIVFGDHASGGKDDKGDTSTRGPARIFIPTVASVLILGVAIFLIFAGCLCCCAACSRRRCAQDQCRSCPAQQTATPAAPKADEEMVVLSDMHDVPQATPAPNSPFNVAFVYNPQAQQQQVSQGFPQFYPVMPQYFGYMPVPHQQTSADSQ